MRIAIIGISGGLGQALAREALFRQHEVVGTARRPENVTLANPLLQLKTASAGDVSSLTSALRGCQVVVSSIGSGGFAEARKPTTVYSTLAASLLPAMQANSIDRVVAVTAGGLVPSPDWPWFYRYIIHPQLREMYLDMQRMEDLIKNSACKYLFVRPAGLSSGPARRVYRVENETTPPKGVRISRADVADYVLQRIEADDYFSEGVGIAY